MTQHHHSSSQYKQSRQSTVLRPHRPNTMYTHPTTARHHPSFTIISVYIGVREEPVFLMRAVSHGLGNLHLYALRNIWRKCCYRMNGIGLAGANRSVTYCHLLSDSVAKLRSGDDDEEGRGDLKGCISHRMRHVQASIPNSRFPIRGRLIYIKAKGHAAALFEESISPSLLKRGIKIMPRIIPPTNSQTSALYLQDLMAPIQNYLRRPVSSQPS